MLQSGTAGIGQFYFMPVCLHEIGHVLGLTHSKTLDDVMAPFYSKEKVALKEGDIARCKKIYT